MELGVAQRALALPLTRIKAVFCGDLDDGAERDQLEAIDLNQSCATA